MGTTKIRKIEVVAKATAELKQETEKELDQKDPENASEIIRLCGQDIKYSGPKL
jgi:hypothetical protein